MECYSFSVKKLNPKTEMQPPKKPMTRLAAGLYSTPLGAPIITPPAKEALRISSMLNFFLNNALIAKEAKQLPVSDIIVLVITKDFS